MRIGLPGGGATVDKIVRQAERAEADGFTSLWYASAVAGDPLVAMALAGRATTSIELGTAVLQTSPAIRCSRPRGRPPSPPPSGRRVGSRSASAPRTSRSSRACSARPTTARAGTPTSTSASSPRSCAAGRSSLDGDDFRVHAGPLALVETVPRSPSWWPHSDRACCGSPVSTPPGPSCGWPRPQRSSGTWHPASALAAAAAGRPDPRIVAGLPVAVHDDVAEARSTAARQFAVYGTLPNYQRILEHGGVSGPADAAIVGDEAAVAAQLEALVAAGATDVWAAPFPVGDDRSASRARTRALLKDLAAG